MARAISDDFLMNMRFFVSVTGPAALENPTLTRISQGTNSSPTAGFSACSIPEGTVGVAEYREGQYVYTRKQPAVPSMNDVTLSRGVAKIDSSFYKWWQLCAEGDESGSDYRGDVVIKHYHRSASLNRANEAAFDPASAAATKEYTLHEAWTPRHKPSTDLDATAGEVSVMELDIAYEWFEMKDGADLPAAP